MATIDQLSNRLNLHCARNSILLFRLIAGTGTLQASPPFEDPTVCQKNSQRIFVTREAEIIPEIRS